jgi:putative DNA primase/helicase
MENLEQISIPECKTDTVIQHREILKTLAVQLKHVPMAQLAKKYDPHRNAQTDIGKGEKHVYIALHIGDEAVKNNWGICHSDGFIYLYNGSYWAVLSDEDLDFFLSEASVNIGIPVGTARHFAFSRELLQQFKKHFYKPAPEMHNRVLINFKTMTMEINKYNDIRQVDGKTHILLRCKDPNDFLKYELSFDYDPKAKCPLYDKFMDWAQPDKKTQTLLHEYIGYCLTPNGMFKLEKVLFNQGGGQNGKSTFRNIVSELFGTCNVEAMSLASLCDDTGYFRAVLANCTVNFCGDIGKEKPNPDIFKTMASGEPLSVRQIRQKPITLTYYGKLMFNCQFLPKEPEDSDGYYRRFLIVRWKSYMPIGNPERDTELSDKIIGNELAGVFNRVLNALRNLMAMRSPEFTATSDSRQALEDYMEESDHVITFVKELRFLPGTENDKGKFYSYEEITREYLSWCCKDDNVPEKERLSGIVFRKRLKVKGFKDEIKTENSINTRGFYITTNLGTTDMPF